MKSLNCDVCGKSIINEISGRSYFHICHREVCESCKDKLDAAMKPVVRTKEPFNYEWYGKLVHDSMEKAIQRGKF